MRSLAMELLLVKSRELRFEALGDENWAYRSWSGASRSRSRRLRGKRGATRAWCRSARARREVAAISHGHRRLRTCREASR